VLLFVENNYLDPALSLLITFYILWNVIKRLKETLVLFLQGHPADINRQEIEDEILKIDHVESLHHTHIWSLDGEHHVFTTHLKLKAGVGIADLLVVKNKIKELMKTYPFEHYTIETELSDEDCALE
jgi:cobalt-zinc-cadmium efflux system protein